MQADTVNCQSKIARGCVTIAVLGLRLDLIILGELRGVKAFTFLCAVNTGLAGLMITCTPTHRSARLSSWRC
jgi:Flp pilus assembly CpaF family ATPase